MKVAKGLIYARQRRQRAMTPSSTTGTGASEGEDERKGVITSAKGSLVFLRRVSEVGMVVRVHRWKEGSALLVGEFVTET